MENINVAFDGERKRIGGWLVFFLVLLLLHPVVGLVISIVTRSPEFTLDGLLFGLCRSITSLSMCLFAVYMVCMFLKRGRNAVFLGKLYSLFYVLFYGWYLLDHLFTRTALPFKGVYIVTFAFYLILYFWGLKVPKFDIFFASMRFFA